MHAAMASPLSFSAQASDEACLRFALPCSRQTAVLISILFLSYVQAESRAAAIHLLHLILLHPPLGINLVSSPSGCMRPVPTVTAPWLSP